MSKNVLVVDDEVHVIRGIEKLLERNGYHVISFSNVRDAVTFIKDNNVFDIIITDICMPGMDGLEFSYLAKQYHKNVEIIIISGYQSFEYAKRCIELSVAQYVLKPINQKELLEVVSSAAQRVDAARKEEKERLIADEKIVAKYMTDVANGIYVTHQIPKNDELSRIAAKHLCIFAIELPELFDARTNEGFLYLSQSLIIPEEEKIGIYLICEYQPAKYMALLYADDKMVFLPYAKELFRRFTSEFEIALHISLSNAFSGIDYLHENVEAAVNTLHSGLIRNDTVWPLKCQSGATTLPPDAGLKASRFFYYVSEIVNVMTRQRGKTELFAITSHLFAEYYLWPIGAVVKSCLRIITCVCFECTRLLSPDKGEEILNHLQHLESIEEASTSFALKQQANKKLLEILDTVTVSLHSGEMDMIAVVDALVRADITSVSIQLAADKLGLSTAYFSAAFKKRAGINFKDYVRNKKIERAKELLQTTLKRIGDICDELGYSETDYFVKVFKKMCGVTPVEYRAQTQRGKGDCPVTPVKETK